ncbi:MULTISPECIES: DUF6624 domain-containing protein [unclassified Caulobacter]|uniref:DUF6624 domain-containing protein n=1 Tax=unclassified Caulobacter TaxID=2648921 RepID=UPI0006F4CB8E|nr:MULTISPECIES: DUF6624 domain-containing protein [unclassified Caulobacter]KQV62832.1 hypothetical protein ASC62_04690 [Caulobacter sp. Root342]KQV71965.1 hypothetical protein ASC70_23965 [Caulobacter sp. Root343]
MIFIALMAALLMAQPIKLERGPMPVARAFGLKRTMGEAAFAADVDAVVGRLQNGRYQSAKTSGPCASPAEIAASAQLELVRRSPDPQAYARSRALAEAALAQRRALRPLYLGGAQVSPPYGLVGRMVARARAEPDARLAELYRRMAEDQFSGMDSLILRGFFGPGVHTTWEKGLDEGALAYVDATIAGEWCPMNVANADWLKAELRDHGWFKISSYGADADGAAWLIVQHARHDLAFQQEVVAMLEPLWQAGETKGANFAMLYDQTAHYTGRPGRFGVMGDCTAPGVWTPAPLEDKGAVDAWRTKAGLPPLAQQIATRSRGCTE